MRLRRCPFRRWRPPQRPALPGRRQSLVETDKDHQCRSGGVVADRDWQRRRPRGASKAKNAKPEVISFGPAIVKPATKPIGIEIASGPSVDGLRLSWSQLTEQNNKLKKLTARYADNGDTANPSFNLIAGPVKSKAEAIRLCKELEAHYQTCKVGEFKGDAL